MSATSPRVGRVSDAHLFEGYGPVSGFDEMWYLDSSAVPSTASVRENYAQVNRSFVEMGDDEVRQRADALASSYLDQGITFGVEGEERPFPLDIVPRLIEAEQWAHVDEGSVSACAPSRPSSPTSMVPASCSPTG